MNLKIAALTIKGKQSQFLAKVNKTKKKEMEIIFRNEGLQPILTNILNHLDIDSILKCRGVCTIWKNRIDKDHLLWKRILKRIKAEKLYVDTTGSKFTILQKFHDWNLVFDFFETRVDTTVLRDFVIALQSTCDFIRTLTDQQLYSPVHIDANRGRHELIRVILDNGFPWDLDTIGINFEDRVDPNRRFDEPDLLNIALQNNDVNLIEYLIEYTNSKVYFIVFYVFLRSKLLTKPLTRNQNQSNHDMSSP